MHFPRSTKPMALDSPENIPGLTERIYTAHRTLRLRRRTTGETSSWRAKPDKAHKVLQGFSPSPRRDIQVAVDLENLGIEVHVEVSTVTTSAECF